MSESTNWKEENFGFRHSSGGYISLDSLRHCEFAGRLYDELTSQYGYKDTFELIRMAFASKYAPSH